MKASSNNTRIPIAPVLLVIALMLLACDLGALTGGPAPGQPTQPPVAQATTVPGQPPAVQPTTAPGQPSPGTPGTGRDALFGTIADASQLNSYRARILLEGRPKDGSKPSSMRLTMEWVKNPPSQHTTMGEGAQAMEVIKIGDKSWIKMGTSWMEVPANQPQSASSNVPDSYLPEQDVTVRPLGDDTVNGVRCKKQGYTGKITIPIPSVDPTKSPTKVTFNVKGDICVANQPGLPAVSIRETAEIDGDLFGSLFSAMLGGASKTAGSVVTYSERELYDINAPITIKPPDNVTKLPAIPTVPGGQGVPTVRPVVKTATPSSKVAATPTKPVAVTTGTPLFTDNFNGTLDSQWVWSDPEDDAKYNVKVRSGFLRITAPDGNDLYSGTNYNAPRLLRPVSGNFIVETLVEFNPTEDYQGAGILIWQEAGNLLRLERAYGGTWGEEGNIAFFAERNGGLDLFADSPATQAKRVELLLQRDGNRFTGWWREPGKTWQLIGSTDFALKAQVQVGLAVTAENGVADSVADFDYLRISRPK